MTPETLIARVRARLSDWFLETIDGVSGEELFAVFAAMFAKAAERRLAMARSRLIRDATGAVRATGTVTVHFSEATGAEAQIIPIGQVLWQTSWGVRYRLTQELTRASDEVAGDEVVAVECERAGWDGNVAGELVTEWALPDPNNPNSIQWDVGIGADGKAEFFDRVASGSITFTASDMTGGRAGTLDLKAQGRGMPRAEGESDESLRKRLRVPPDAVTPAGILRAVNQALGYDGATMVEYWDYGFVMGESAMGEDCLANGRGAIVLVPAGSDLVALQELVDRLKGAGYTVTVMEAA
jgi:hypothetical protein